MKKLPPITGQQTSLFTPQDSAISLIGAKTNADILRLSLPKLVKTREGGSKPFRIVLPDDPQYVPISLIRTTGNHNFGFPPILRDVAGIRKILYETESDLGLDLEFSTKTEKPSVLGLASRNYACAVPWDTNLMGEILEHLRGRKLVGHAVLGADRPVVEKAVGRKTALLDWRCSMLTHYLANADFAKAPEKGEDPDDTSSLGFMGLWSASTMVMRTRNWKACAGKGCPEEICPRHDVFGYCAADSFAGLVIHEENWKTLQRYKVPESFYFDTMELAEICDTMERRGIAVDRKRVAELRKEMKESKDSIFDFHMEGKNKVFERFNPASPEQSINWFRDRGVQLETNDKKNVQKATEKLLERFGFENKDAAREQDELPEILDAILDLFDFKESGKGPDPWFGDKYFGSDGLLHPRFILTGSSTGRLASSKPNAQNLGKRGWARLLKSCIIPRDPNCDLLASDSSQLELRFILWLAELDPSLADGIFEWLVENSNGAYVRASDLGHMSERDVAKSVTHATGYLEGLTLLSGADLMRPNIKADIAAGALVIYKDWEYCGKVVGFTGSNLADRLFGNHERESRKLANTLREQYVSRFPQILEWQKRSLNFVQDNGYIQLPTGRFLRLYGTDRDNAKIAVATQGQGGGADYVQGTMLRFNREQQSIPILNVHDELTFEIPKFWSDKRAYEFISMMYEETSRMPGFKAPGKCKRGPNYGDMRPLVI